MEPLNASRKLFHRRLLSHFFTILVAYLLVLLLVRIFESRLVFFPNYPDRLEGDWQPRSLNVEDVWLKDIHAPILIVHCNQDPVIPFHFGREVYADALSPKSFLQVNGACHEEASLIDPIQYQTALRKFLDSF